MKFPRLGVESFSLSANADVEAAMVSPNGDFSGNQPEINIEGTGKFDRNSVNESNGTEPSTFVPDDELPPLAVVSDAEAERLLAIEGANGNLDGSTSNAEGGGDEPAVNSPPVPRKAKIARRRMLDLAHDMARRHNEFLDLFRGEYALSSWASSIFINALVIGIIVLIALLFEREETRRPPLSIIAGVEIDGVQNLGELLPDELPELQVDSVELPAPSFNGGASQAIRPDLSSLLGNGGSQNPGAGVGTGTGDGAGVGAAIAKRVEAAGGQGGKMRIAIAWDNVNDLDLHMITPRDERIFFGRMIASCGGVLDVDRNATPPLTSEAVENIRWLDDVPRDGMYQVQVHFYGTHYGGGQKTAYSVLMEVGSETHLFKGVVTPGRLITVVVFNIKDGKLGKIASKLKESDEGELVAGQQLSEKNLANRERFAKEALDEALQTTKQSILIGRLRRIMQTYAGTAAAVEARKKLEELGASPN